VGAEAGSTTKNPKTKLLRRKGLPDLDNVGDVGWVGDNPLLPVSPAVVGRDHHAIACPRLSLLSADLSGANRNVRSQDAGVRKGADNSEVTAHVHTSTKVTARRRPEGRTHNRACSCWTGAVEHDERQPGYECLFDKLESLLPELVDSRRWEVVAVGGFKEQIATLAVASSRLRGPLAVSTWVCLHRRAE
jgi:hypothetical protein